MYGKKIMPQQRKRTKKSRFLETAQEGIALKDQPLRYLCLFLLFPLGPISDLKVQSHMKK